MKAQFSQSHRNAVRRGTRINADIPVCNSGAEEVAQRLSSRILAAQDEERRKIARELHDCLGQYLTSLKINLDFLSHDAGDHGATRSKAERLAECLETVEQCLTETRTLSHLMHPPLLDEVGFSSAASWYADGFAKRSGLEVKFSVLSDLPRLPSTFELALFRVLQESLTNVHRHSACSAVNITVGINAQQVTLKIKDNGRGIPKERLDRIESGAELGVGLAGMRERIRDLGGRLQLQSNSTGTTVTAFIPVPQTTKSGSASGPAAQASSAA
jgi:two-component system, NarL family, sensor kinase